MAFELVVTVECCVFQSTTW